MLLIVILIAQHVWELPYLWIVLRTFLENRNRFVGEVRPNPKNHAGYQIGRGEFRIQIREHIRRTIGPTISLLRLRTLAEILKRSGRLGEFKINPQAFMAGVAQEISRALHDLMLEGIKYEKVAGAFWEQSRIEQEAEEGIVRYLSNLYEVQNREKSLFDAVEYESEVEKQFARDLDSNENVKLFVKLPRWFTIDTPIGAYNPDWAFVTEREEKLYFVRETKSTLDSEERRTKENQKIACGRRHFETLGVDFGVVTSLQEVAI